MTRPSLGPYTLLRRIGVGGMGEVWIARREAIGGAAKLVALKTVLPEKASNAESRSMFLDEARLAMLMTNSNIVQVFDVDETEDNICYMAMEYVEGL
ncbi:MAG: protein kinase, partial [Myxococcales bacterium]|nr:protein kinase [Myxococcales bacterium]